MKITIKALLIILLFVGCNSNDSYKPIPEHDPGSFRTVIREFGYNGHDYIYFRYYIDESGTIIHSPDCHCFKDSIK